MAMDKNDWLIPRCNSVSVFYFFFYFFPIETGPKLRALQRNNYNLRVLHVFWVFFFRILNFSEYFLSFKNFSKNSSSYNFHPIM